MGQIQILSQKAERDRLRAYDPQLLITKTVMVGDTVVREEYSLNDERERARIQEVVEALVAVTTEDPMEAVQKGVAPEVVADEVYGSRVAQYASRVRSLCPYDGPISMSLENGYILDITGQGLIIKTVADEHFVGAVNRSHGKLVDLASRGVQRNVGRFNSTTAMLARRNPNVADLVDEKRQQAMAELEIRVPAALKALAPSPTKKSGPGNGKKTP